MRITSAVLQRALIGLDVEVVSSTDPTHLGLAGRVIDETRNTFIISHHGEAKTLIKGLTRLHLTLPGGGVVEVDGKTLIGRPENRIKKQERRRW